MGFRTLPTRSTGSGSAAETVYSFQGYIAPYTGQGEAPANQRQKLRIRYGSVNSQVPANIDQEFLVSGEEFKIWLEVSFNSSGAVTGISLDSGNGEVPSDPPGGSNGTPPAKSYMLVLTAELSESGDSVGEIYQNIRNSQQITTVLNSYNCTAYGLSFQWSAV